MDNSEASLTTQLDFGAVTHLDVAHQHVANEVLQLLESGQTNIAAIAYALQDYQETLLFNFSRLNHFKQKKDESEDCS